MKKFFPRVLTLMLIVLSATYFTACTYTKDGSVIQDVDYKISYEYESETVDVNGTMSIYKTFAPQTFDRVLGLIKDGFYNNSSLVFDESGTYLVLGSFDYKDGNYVDKKYTGDGLYGEFSNNGYQSHLSIEAGSLVMLREPDTGVGEKKRDTAKATIAICLTATPSGLSNSEYCVFGKIDQDSVTSLNTLKNRLFADKDGYSSMRLVGLRSETTGLLEDDGASYKGAFNYFTNGTEYFNLVNGTYKLFTYAEETDPDYNNYKAITENSEYVDRVVLPQTPVTISSFKVK